MPKPTKKNAFFYFMLHFKNEQRKKGIIYEDLKAVAVAADPEWKKLTDDAKATYHDSANKSVSERSKSQADIERIQKEEVLAQETEITNVKHWINSLNSSVSEESFFVLDVNAFCSVLPSGYLIGEMVLVRFSLKNGITEHYHELINPGKIPMGYGTDVKYGCKELALDFPDENKNVTNYNDIGMHMENMLRQNSPKTNTLPPIFTVADKVDQVKKFLSFLSHRSSLPFKELKIYKLDFMFFTLINSLKTNRYEGLSKESLATVVLKKDPFSYSPGIACDHHDMLDRTNDCCKSRAFRWCFTIMDRCCPLAGIKMLPGHHLPPELEDKPTLYYKNKETRRPPTFAGIQASTSGNTSNESMNDSFIHRSFEDHKVERTHTPLRMPKIRPSELYTQASEIDEPDPLRSQNNVASVSIGRGRGNIVAMMKKLGKW